MGCGASKPQGFNIEEEFRKSNWPMPDAKTFESEFEKEAWLTVNVLRANPKALIGHIKDVKSKLNIHRSYFDTKFVSIDSLIYRQQGLQRKELECID